MTESWVDHEVSADGAVHTITIDKAPGNVIDIALCGQLLKAIESAAVAHDGRVLVLRGAGKHFSFGASVEEHLPEKAPEMIAALGAVIRSLVAFPYPTVVGVQGSCLGGGLELVLACGIVIADEAAQFASPEIQLGVLPPVATALLTGRVAEDLLLTGRALTSEEAMAKGIVNVVADQGDLDDAIDSFVQTYFVPRSALSLRMATRAIREPQRAALEKRLDHAESLYIDELLDTHDGVEGIRAFIEKRPPVWKNA
ncbi:MAG: enoyl-CoA hydratase [Acidimicrobiia bacterium]|nr:MAG: enoyl-CoA hydratase [Acidimicrobiia bacterium]